ncbi:MAG: glycoside hydrolase family 43 protein [Treponema sp.]
MKITIKSILCGVLLSSVIFSCKFENTNTNGTTGNSETTNTSDENLNSYVYSKYSNGTTLAGYTQTKWNAVNCHDPKLFQDTDGTYYVYATDASCGNIGNVGLHVRYSTDLINWKGSSSSAIAGYWDKSFIAWEDYTASSSEVKQNNSSYTAYTWAPTVIKQNGLYYMYHGVNATNAVKSGSTTSRWTSSITLAIASSAKGPFYPAEFISSYNADSDTDKNESDIVSIQDILENLNISYAQSFLVRYAAGGGSGTATTTSVTPTIDGAAVASPDYSKTNNNRFGCIDPEFVYDMSDGNLMTYTIGSNTCYAMIYGSWMNGISVVYVDSDSLKPVATEDFTDGNNNSISTGDELEMSLDEANYYAYPTSTSAYHLIGTRIAGGYSAGYEGAQLIYNSNTGYYYIFVSMGDLSYEYRVGVGRCKTIDGAYLDPSGKSMLLSNTSTDENYKNNYHAIGGKILGAVELNGEYSWRCPGGESIFRNSDGQIIIACHSRTNFQMGYYFYLQCRQMFFNEELWPVLNQNEYYNDYTDITTDGTEELSALSKSDIAGTYDTILTVRGAETSVPAIFGETLTAEYNTCDSTPTASKTMVISENGTVSGDNYSGTWTLASDGYTITINLKDSSGAALGTFKGYVLNAVDWARKGSVDRRTITFTTLCSNTAATEAGEYFWGNKQAD